MLFAALVPVPLSRRAKTQQHEVKQSKSKHATARRALEVRLDRSQVDYLWVLERLYIRAGLIAGFLQRGAKVLRPSLIQLES